MENNKMRCHFSIIFEKTGSFLIFWIVLALNWADEVIDVLISGDFASSSFRHALPVCIVLVLLLFAIMGYQFMVWRKTFIYLEEETFVVERNTLNRQKSTIAISSIANINLEQNLFERIVGTYRLKLDTNSLSTAMSTDVSIVLSARKAQALKKELLFLMKKNGTASNASLQGDTKSNCSDAGNTLEIGEIADVDFSYASAVDVLSHCFFSISTPLLVLALAVIAGIPLLVSFGDVSFWELISEEDSSFKGRFLALLILVITYGYSLIKQLLSFYHFGCIRRGNELIIRYGFFRKQDFTIPLERINAIRIVQPPLARLAGLMQAQLICVGIGDSDTEKPQLTLCMKKKAFYARLQELLPEFSTEESKEVHKLPHGSGISYFLSTLSFLLCFSAGFFVTRWNLSEGNTLSFSSKIAYFVVVFLLILYRLLHYLCMGTTFGREQLIIHGGAFQKQIWLIPYGKIQYATLRENPFCRWFHIVRGEVYILASLENNTITLPFIDRNEAEQLSRYIIADKPKPLTERSNKQYL